MRHLLSIALCAVAAVRAVAATNGAVPDSYLREIVAQMEIKWPSNRTVNIVCHGHSVPAGYAHTPVVDTFNAYPDRLHHLLKERFPYAVINVIVTAIGGEDSVQGQARFARDVLTHQPDVVLIDYGLNDRRVGLPKAKAAWSAMICEAQAAQVRVILLTPTMDARAKVNDPNAPLNAHADQIRKLAGEYHVGLVDSLALCKAELAKGVPLADLVSQPNHPSARVHALVAEGLQKWFPPGR